MATKASLYRLVRELEERGPSGFLAWMPPAVLLGVGEIADMEDSDGDPQSSQDRTRFVDWAKVLKDAEAKRPRSEERSGLRSLPGATTDIVWGIPRSGSELVLGRSKESDVLISELSVSDRHCLLRWTGDDAIEIEDCGSRNGLWFGETRAEPLKAHRLRDGQYFSLGRLLFKFMWTHTLVEELMASGARRASLSTVQSSQASGRHAPGVSGRKSTIRAQGPIGQRMTIDRLTADLWDGRGNAVSDLGAAAFVGIGRHVDLEEEEDFRDQTMQVDWIKAQLTQHKREGVRPPLPRVESSPLSGIVWFVPYDAAPLILGRTDRANIVIPDYSISEDHCTLRWRSEGALEISDSGSTNGLWVNGRRSVRARRTVLKSGDFITIGRMQFQFRYLDDLRTEIVTKLHAFL